MTDNMQLSLFYDEMVATAIERIQKFARLSEAMGYDVRVGFSGGKDSQVVYDLCKKSGIKFTAFYNVACESSETRRFIRKNYPDVIWRQPYKVGFIKNIDVHKGMLPSVYTDCDNGIFLKVHDFNPDAEDAFLVFKREEQEQMFGKFLMDSIRAKMNCDLCSKARIDIKITTIKD